ncbi:hypothetical protein FQR65_LT12222 [Abscondita terminalis]|nr:hypothetical protein FQR65_LT12222 [Abscondita terminalis]
MEVEILKTKMKDADVHVDKDITKKQRERREKRKDCEEKEEALATVCAHSVSISIGICQSYSAILIPQLSKADFRLTSHQSSWAASLGAVSNPVGSILSGVLAEFVGRKAAIALSSVPFLIGWLCIGMAKDVTLLYTGRLITGIATGMSTASYTYVAEISPPEKRGSFQSLGPISASFGVLLTFTLGTYLKWNVVALISSFFSIFTMVGIQLVPESPSYLLKKGKRIEGFNSLLWFRRSNSLAQEELDRFEADAKTDNDSLKMLILSPSTIKPFFILVALFFLQELSGIYTILYYAVDFFEKADLNMDEHVSSIIIGIIRFVMSIVTAALLNKFGRKTLCMVSSGGMAATMFVATLYFEYFETQAYATIPLIGVLLNVFFSMIGMLPIPWILVSELFPLRVRPIMGGFVICLAQCFIFVCVKIYYDMIECLRFSGTLLTFSLAAVVALAFSKWVLPETKDKTLDEIERYFKGEEGRNVEIYTIRTE